MYIAKCHSTYVFMVLTTLLLIVNLCSCQIKPTPEVGARFLKHDYYKDSCPQAEDIVESIVRKAVNNDARMAASLLRLHFHDCFVQGCDASILLNSAGKITSEKGSNPNRNSARGYEVIDEIKKKLEKDCPKTVSCADIMALAARDSTKISQGPYWRVPLGRRDSTGASLSGSNNDIPAPNNTFHTILTKFKRYDLNIVDLVALSGSHTIGNSRCTSFRQRLYNQSGDSKPDSTLDPDYAKNLTKRCPSSGGDNNLFFLNPASPKSFDNSYFNDLLNHKGLLSSDQVLADVDNKDSRKLVLKYAKDQRLFFKQFALSMIKMGNIIRLNDSNGEIRKNCRKINNS